MAAAQKLAGYSLGQADLLRRAMGKKKKEVLDKEYIPFRDGMKVNGFSEKAVAAIWEVLVPFADYAFNKSHSAAYGLISYWTAYLKAHYPAEYMAAVLTSVGDDKDKAAMYLHECRTMGITVLSPDVNESELHFTAVGTDIRFGLGGVKGVGENVVNTIVKERENGPYKSFEDFAKRAVGANKKTHESLIKAGAFDTLHPARLGLTMVIDQVVKSNSESRKKQAAGQFDLFSSFGIEAVAPLEVPTDEWDKKARLAFEREMLGLYVSAHPLDDVDLSHENPTPIAFLASEDFPDKAEVKIAGLLTSVEHKVSKAGNAWGKVVLEDKDGSVEVCFFSRTYEAYKTHLVPDEVVVIAGKVDKGRDNGITVLAGGLRAPSQASVRQPMVEDFSTMVVVLDSESLTPSTINGIKSVLSANPGEVTVEMELPSGRRLPSAVKCSGSLSARLQMREVPSVREILFV
jgi:DNA polymerase-3 subunit alpha